MTLKRFGTIGGVKEAVFEVKQIHDFKHYQRLFLDAQISRKHPDCVEKLST